MLPNSHPEPIFAGLPHAGAAAGLRPLEAGLLADAFSEFIAASARLEASYRDLQGEVAQLGGELADRNVALEQSLDENRGMRRFLEQVLDSMPCGVLVVSGGDRIERINPEACRLLGIERPEALSLRDVSERVGIGLQACSAMEGEQQFTMAWDGAPRWIEMRTRRVDAENRPARSAQTILILRDITMQRQAEQEREAARNAMALAEIAATLAHEIRNPLASLELFGGLIAGEATSERTVEWVEHLRAGIRVLSGTVNDVLSFYGGGFADLAPLPVSATVFQAVEFVRPIAAQAGVDLVFVGLAQEQWLRGSESALGQVILNLVCNAVRYTPHGGKITVSVTTPRDGWIAMQCRDTGCGIAREHVSEIFRAGFSGGGMRSGLGLAVCRRIAGEHGGSLSVSTELGQGTTFVMEIPRA
jgi:two-component system sensor histidine kinase FlrB